MAMREGFEPSVLLSKYDDLANRCLKPLGHLTVTQVIYITFRLVCKPGHAMNDFHHCVVLGSQLCKGQDESSKPKEKKYE